MWPAPHADLGVASRNRQRDQPRRHHGAGGKNGITGGYIQTGRADELSFARHFVDGDCRAVRLSGGADILLQQDGVGAIRNHGAGENPHGLSGCHNAIPGLASGGFANPCQQRRGCRAVGGADSVAIHCRYRGGRQAQPCGDVGCQNAAHDILQRTAFGL